MRWVGIWHVGGRRAWSVLVGSPEGRRPIVRPRHRWEDDNQNGS